MKTNGITTNDTFMKFEDQTLNNCNLKDTLQIVLISSQTLSATNCASCNCGKAYPVKATEYEV